MVVGGFLAGAAGGATIGIVIKAIDRFSGVFSKARAATLGLGVAFTALGIAGAGAIVGLTKMAGQFEQTQIAFTTMLGSAEEADKLLKELADFAARTPFTIPGIEKNAKLLLAMGIETEKLLPTLKALGDVSAGLSVPLERIALNFGQVKTQAKLTGRELRDFNIAGVPLIQEIAKNMDLTEKEVKELVSAGTIGFDEVEKAFITMSSEGGKFFDLMEAQSRTLLGRLSNIQDSFIKLARIMGNVFLPAAKGAAQQIETLVALAEEHPTIAKFAAVFLGVGVALALIIGPVTILLALLPFIVTALTAVSIAGLPVWLAAIAITAAFVGLIAIVVLVIDVFRMLKENMDEFKIGVAKIWNDIIGFFEAGVNRVISTINFLIRAFNRIAGLVGFKGISELGKVSLGRIDISAMTAAAAAQREVTKEATRQTTELTKQEQLVKDLAGFKLVKATGDIFDPRAFTAAGFETRAGFEFARRFVKGEQRQLGDVISINIENLVGLDPEEIARALNEMLKEKTSL